MVGRAFGWNGTLGSVRILTPFKTELYLYPSLVSLVSHAREPICIV